MSASRLTALFGAGRVAYAAALLAAPGPVAGGWVGEPARHGPAQIGLRGLAARDLLASAGIVVALGRGARVRPWLVGCALGDLADVAATLAVADELPGRARPSVIAVAGGSALAGLALAVALER